MGTLLQYLELLRKLMDSSPTKLNVILGCDPLLGPATGIGNYTHSLAVELYQNPLVDLKLYAHGAYFSPESLLVNAAKESSSDKIPFYKKVREWLALQPAAITLYKQAVPLLDKWRLAPFKNNYLFHSPNFIVPHFDGVLVTTFHDLSTQLMAECHPNERSMFLNQKMIEAVESNAHIITCSNLVKEQVCRYYGLPSFKVDVVPLAADNCFKPRATEQTEFQLSSLGLVYRQFFLFVSTIEPRKNLLRQLRAFECYWQLAKNPFPLVIVGGSGWNSAAEHELISKLALKGAVHYLGFASNATVTALYSSARALLFVSRYEGFGLPALEAMQSGCPVITSCNSAMAEVSKNAALLVDFEDVQAISAALLLLAEDDEKRAWYAEQGLEVAAAYKWSNTAEQTIAVYKRLIAERLA